jgi:hypothetical protein
LVISFRSDFSALDSDEAVWQISNTQQKWPTFKRKWCWLTSETFFMLAAFKDKPVALPIGQFGAPEIFQKIEI